MMFFVKGIRARIVIGGLIIFSGSAVLFPEETGLIVGLVIGLFIMVMEQLGLKISNWGWESGGWMGNWAIGFGEWMGNWARGFAETITRMNLLRSIQMLGTFMMIIAGLVIIGIIIDNFNRTQTRPELTT
jgi:hypothetical protein